MWKQVEERKELDEDKKAIYIITYYKYLFNTPILKKEVKQSETRQPLFYTYSIFETAVFRKRIIQRNDGAPYLIRYYILSTPWFRVRLHNILLSDYDCLHDHPWNFLSVVLWNGYKELYNDNPVPLAHKAPKFLYRKAEDSHRLIVDKPAWTLVFMFKRRREWGFFTKKGWKFWKDYIPTQTCE